MFKSVLLLQKTVIWSWASFIIEKYISQQTIGYICKTYFITFHQFWNNSHCSKNVKKNENSHIEILACHLSIILLLELLLKWVFCYIRFISKRRDRHMLPNSLCILGPKVGQWWALTPLVIAEVEVRSLSSIWWSGTSFRTVNLTSSIIFFSLWRHLIKNIHVLLSKLRGFLTINYDIKIHSGPVQKASQTVFWKSFTYTDRTDFKRISFFISSVRCI